MSEEVVVDERVSRVGLHSVHVMRMGGAVDVEDLIRRRASEEMGCRAETWMRWREEELGVEHVMLWWWGPEGRCGSGQCSVTSNQKAEGSNQGGEGGGEYGAA